MNIKILCNTMNPDLYEISRSFYEKLPYEKIGVDGTNKFYSLYFLDSLCTNEQYKDIDMIVHIDEDCFIIDTKALQELIDYVITNNIDAVGMPDGGVSCRSHNPISINEYFCILNLKNIRTKYNHQEVMDIRYTPDLNKYAPMNLMKTTYTFDEFEPVYKYFFWLLVNGFKILYLDAEQCSLDKATTLLKNHNNIPIAYHTWRARQWKEPIQNKRITNVINHCKKLVKDKGITI